jgi:Bacterial Ig domain
MLPQRYGGVCAYTFVARNAAISGKAVYNHHYEEIKIMSLTTGLFVKLRRYALIALAAVGLIAPLHAGNNPLAHHDHVELDAALVAPYTSERANEARTFTLKFSYPTDAAIQVARWRVQLRAPDGALVEEWRGTTPLTAGQAEVNLEWAGRTGKSAALPDGIYRVHMSTFAIERSINTKLSPEVSSLDEIAKVTDADVIDQTWDIRVGNPPVPAMPEFAPLKTNSARAGAEKSAAATASLPYTVYYGNLHSQTNHSDGGGNVSSCTSSQAAQTGQFGPADAFPYAKNAGLDFLMTSEHNHYFDGSSGTNASASPTTVKNLYQSGLSTASNYNASNPGFLALYGMEWGVISNGGHMNIFNSSELFGWETNSSGQLLADALTPKSDYAAVYAAMKQRGLVGQFNHPDSSGQFIIGGTSLAYSADADEVMVLSEVLNTSAFSNNTTETETGRSSFEGTFNILLERGFHVAPASNQDNHCANWGKSYTNRTAVLLPNGAAFNNANFIDALKARRVFATMDKNSQLILTANGRLMGERFQNSGVLNLTANFANTAGRSVSTVTIYEGVPGRNGTVTALTNSATASITPSLGNHFYYAKVTQDDGNILWSAPVWVEQVAAATDTTAPTVSASSSGTSGSISFTATASDNVGVTRVEFYVDNVLKGTDTSSPYTLAFDSTTVANGTHNFTAKAYDAAGNIGTSSAVSFTVNNATASTTFNEVESNGTIATANVVGRSITSIVGTMGNTTDKDYFAISLNANEKITLNMTGPSGKDYDLYLVNSAGTTLASSLGSTTTESLSYTNTATAKTVYVLVIAYSGSSTTLTYTVKPTYQ